MAKISSTARPPSRGKRTPAECNVLGAASAPRMQRTTRATRSASREPEAITHVQQQKFKSPVKRGTGRGSGSGSGKAKAKATAKANVADLETVAEDVDGDNAEEPVAAVPEQQAAAIGADHDIEHWRRESANSALSGTTAKTSFSQEEIAEMDGQVMIEVLPDLHQAAENMIKLLLPTDTTTRPYLLKEVRTAGSRYNKLYKSRLASLDVCKTSFTSQEFIDPGIAVRALLSVLNMREVSDGPWRPDPSFYKVNLAQMLRTTLVTIADCTTVSLDGYNAFQLLETHFKNAIAGSDFDQEAAILLRDIQIQLALMHVERFRDSPHLDPVEVITDSFFKRDADGDIYYKDIEALQMGDVDEDEIMAWTHVMTDIANEMRARFEQGGSLDAALLDCRSAYTWTQFTDHVISYFQHRNAQLDQQLATSGGFEQVMDNLRNEVESRNDARVASSKRQSIAVTGTPRKSFGKSSISALKAREQRLSGVVAVDAPVGGVLNVAQADTDVVEDRAPPPHHMPVQPVAHIQMTAPVQGQNAADNRMPPPIDDTPEQALARQGAISALHLSGFQDMQRQNAKKGKGRFIDPQPDAQRIEFDSQPSPQRTARLVKPSASSAAAPQASGSRKRRAEDEAELEDFEPTQDEGFEVDTRGNAAANARRRTAPASTSAAPPRQLPPTTNNIPPRERTPTPSPSKRARKNPGSTIPPPLPPTTASTGDVPKSELFTLAKTMAKHSRVVSLLSKPVQVRRPWTKAEENQLSALIEEHGSEGVSYATLKAKDAQEGGLLHGRGAEDMRFKARNMKVTWLLAQLPLPDNWDYVVLNRQAIDQLRRRGIEYDQPAIRQARMV
ncbi:hypothetical protein LTR62_007683 [Meristemomyces frigidus]|uniref:Myb-like domain-containing protein n=1 Tax=Meristemomyces frigidus TaxID=1508187 RepID=A0AAN7YM99_9PEZI|nr:hypothetical protein LTR62_007683 [Meristemomyces frigidus]